MHSVLKASMLFFQSASRVDVSQPQMKMKVTSDFPSLNLLAKLRVLHCQILFSLAIAAAILMRISAEQVPSLHRVAPSYLKLVTSSNIWPFTLISALMLFVLLVIILLFSVLTSFPYAVTLSTRVCW